MTRRAGSGYDIRVRGHLDDHWSARLAGLTVHRLEDGTTSLRGPVSDQAQLHAVLAGIRDLGVDLLTVHAVPEVDPAPVLDRVLTTDRLSLRPATPDDARATWAYRRLPSVNRWLTGCPARFDGYLGLFTDPDRLADTVVVVLGRDAAGLVIGDFMLRRQDAWAQLEVLDEARAAEAELGWVLDPAHEGHGYATEAVRALLRYAFEDLGVHRVTANCFVDNTESWRLMERVGMRRELHAVQESRHRSGRWSDTVGYAVLREEWPERSASTD